MDWATEKWGGHPHYRGFVEHLGVDEHGVWLWGPAGRTIFRGEAELFTTSEDALTVIAPEAWWAPCWWVDHPDVDLYVNINTPAVWEGDRVVSIDLDLDVVRFTDGHVEIVDQDEFETHQHLYNYPAEVVAAAAKAAETALDLVSRGTPPFDGVAAHAWIEYARKMQRRLGRSGLD